MLIYGAVLIISTYGHIYPCMLDITAIGPVHIIGHIAGASIIAPFFAGTGLSFRRRVCYNFIVTIHVSATILFCGLERCKCAVAYGIQHSHYRTSVAILYARIMSKYA